MINTLLVALVVGTVVAIPFAVKETIHHRNEELIKRCSKKTYAEILGYVKRRSGGNIILLPVYRYDVNGKMYDGMVGKFGLDRAYGRSKNVPILYDPDEPEFFIDLEAVNGGKYIGRRV